MTVPAPRGLNTCEHTITRRWKTPSHGQVVHAAGGFNWAKINDFYQLDVWERTVCSVYTWRLVLLGTGLLAHTVPVCFYFITIPQTMKTCAVI